MANQSVAHSASGGFTDSAETVSATVVNGGYAVASGAADAGAAAANPIVKTTTVQAGSGHLTLNLELDQNAANAPASYLSGWTTAATQLSQAISDPITVNIEIGYGEYPANNSSITVSGEALGGPVEATSASYPQLRSFLLATGANDVVSAVNALPDTSSLNGKTTFFLANAQAKAFGQLPASGTAVDGYTGFGSGITSNAIVGVALHEFTHAMGRVDGATELSLFDYTSSGVHDFGNTAAASYFSIDGGKTVLADFGLSSDTSDFLNNSLTTNDSFDEFYIPGSTVQSLTSLDLTTLDMLGFGGTVSSGGSAEFAAPQLSLSTFGTSAAAGSWTSQNINPRELADVNGDGKADIVGFGADGVYVSLATGGGKFAASNSTLSSFGTSTAAGSWTSQDQNPRLLADVNGDGLADIVGFGADGVYVSLATSGGKFAASNSTLSSFGTSTAAGSWTSQDQNPRLLADVNGDGLADIVGFGADGVYVSLATSGGKFAAPVKELTAFGTSADAGSWTSEDFDSRQLADVNGDGMADIVGFGADGVYVSLATGGGKFAAPVRELTYFGTSAAAGSWTSQNLNPRELADVNGDGMADIVGFGANGVYVSLATGGGKFAAPVLALSNFGTTTAAGSWTSQNQDPRALADVNGDGMADIVGFGSDGVYVSLANSVSATQQAAFSFTDLSSAPLAGSGAGGDTYALPVPDLPVNQPASAGGFSADAAYLGYIAGSLPQHTT